MVYVNIFSAEHLYVVLGVGPKNNFLEQQSQTPLSVDKCVPGKVSAAVTEGFAVEGRVSPTKSLAKPTG